MNLDPRTLLFCLILTYTLTVLSLLVAAGRNRVMHAGLAEAA
jgi:hypothetical protein